MEKITKDSEALRETLAIVLQESNSSQNDEPEWREYDVRNIAVESDRAEWKRETRQKAIRKLIKNLALGLDAPARLHNDGAETLGLPLWVLPSDAFLDLIIRMIDSGDLIDGPADLSNATLRNVFGLPPFLLPPLRTVVRMILTIMYSDESRPEQANHKIRRESEVYAERNPYLSRTYSY